MSGTFSFCFSAERRRTSRDQARDNGDVGHDFRKQGRRQQPRRQGSPAASTTERLSSSLLPDRDGRGAVTSSALTGAGLKNIWDKILEYFSLVRSNGYDRRRREQDRYWMYESIETSLKDSFYDNAAISQCCQRAKMKFSKAARTLSRQPKKLSRAVPQIRIRQVGLADHDLA